LTYVCYYGCMAQINMQMLNRLKQRIEAESAGVHGPITLVKQLLRSEPKVSNVPSLALRQEGKHAA